MKRILIACSALLLALAAALPSSAANPKISLSRAEGKIGEDVKIVLSLAENPGIMSLNLNLEYDTDVLKLVSVTDGGILGAEIKHQDSLTSPYTFSWADYLSEQDYSEDGTLCTLSFRIIGGEAGKEYPLSLQLPQYGVMNQELDEIPAVLSDGGITVTGGSAKESSLPWIIAGFCGGILLLGGGIFYIIRLTKKK